MAEIVYIGLGSNLGDRERLLGQAVHRMEGLEGLELTALSAIYRSRPVDMPDDAPEFLNQVVRGDYEYAPGELLHALEKIESELGREEKGQNQPRPIDLDLLLFGDREINTDNLIVPHAQLLKRAFVLIPLLQIDPELVHPVSGKPLADFVTTGGQSTVEIYKDHVAREI